LGEVVEGMMKRGDEVGVFVVNYPHFFKLEGKLPAFHFLNSSILSNKLATYDLLHGQFSFPVGFLLTLLKRVHGRRVLVHTHGYDVFSVPSIGYGLRRSRLGRLFAQYTWTRASSIIAVCNKSRIEILKSGIPSAKVSVLYNGVNTELFRRRNVQDERLVRLREVSDIIFLNMGTFTPVKNQVSLLLAFGRFVKNHKTFKRPKLVICGKGPEQRVLLEKAHELGIREQVIFMGNLPHNKMPEILNIADVFVLPSFSEGHPWSLLEAMSCEVPSIASAVGGIPETIQDTRFAITPPTLSTNPSLEIYEKMVLLANDRNLRKTAGAENRRIVTKKFSLERHIENLRSIYVNVLEVANVVAKDSAR
jgi:glycosyltransferase involved in cell wall biosynthesis